MSAPEAELYPILEIHPEWVLEPEALGSKEKFWYKSNVEPTPWLFKFPQEGTGQHWSEKVAAECARVMRVSCARVELAIFEETRGSACESFSLAGWELVHGNQALAGHVLKYDPEKEFQQSDHTLENIFLALDRTFAHPDGASRAKERMASYLVLDAVIGNTDRHHENWGVLRRRTGGGWIGSLAPSYDHASSLGRELADEGDGRSRRKLLNEGKIGHYVERGRGAIFWSAADKHPVSPLELVRRAAGEYPEAFRSAMALVQNLSRERIENFVARVPSDWMSALARNFAVELMCFNVDALKRVAL